MAEMNKDEARKCVTIGQTAFRNGDTEKATRFFQKAQKMCPGDSSIEAMIEEAKRGSSGGSGGGGGGGANASQGHARMPASAAAGSTAGSGGVRKNKEGEPYTAEMAQIVQRILRTKDYYAALDVSKDASDDEIKKAYKKIALKLHPDKNKAPGAEEAFKKLSKVYQGLSNPESKEAYDRYGDEERIPQQQRHHHQQDFMTPDDLFAAFFGGGAFHAQHHHHHRGGGGGEHGDPAQAQRAQLMQMLPVIVLVIITLASNLASNNGGSRFSFTPTERYRQERNTASLGVQYYVTDDFEELYHEGTRVLAEFEQQVEIYYVRSLHTDCDSQEQVMYKKVMMAKRRNSEEDLKKARDHPRPACKEIDRIKRRSPQIYRQAMYMGAR